VAIKAKEYVSSLDDDFLTIYCLNEHIHNPVITCLEKRTDKYSKLRGNPPARVKSFWQPLVARKITEMHLKIRYKSKDVAPVASFFSSLLLEAKKLKMIVPR
jgi:hypothetical protein